MQPDYPGFAGLSSAIGLVTELRFFRYFGIELDVLYTRSKGSADMRVTNFATKTESGFELEVGHAGLSLPLLFKAIVPGKTVSPFFFLGPEFVRPEDKASFTVTGENTTPTAYAGYTKDYTMFTFGLGFEFHLPIPKVDLRIPLSIRGAYNPGVEDTRESRVRYSPDSGPPIVQESFAAEWQYTIRAQLGLTANF